MVASDRISTYDVVHPTPIPDKGKVLTGLSVFWFERTEADRAQPPRLVHRRARGGARPRRCSSSGSRWFPSSAWCAGTSPARAGRTTPPRAPSAGSSCRPACAESRAAAGADLHARDEGRAGRSRREHRLRPRGRDRRRPGARSRSCAGSRSRSTSYGGRARARARDHPRRHQVRVRAPRRRHDRARRRGAHPGLVALLAGRRLRAGPRPAVVRQAVRARLGRRIGLGQVAARAAELPADVVEGTREPYVGGLRADHGRALRRLARERAGG